MNEIATLLGRSDLNRIQDLGYAVIDPFLQSHVCDELSQQLEALAPSGRQRRGGVRDLFACSPATCALVSSAPIREIVEQVLSPKAWAVRAILFDKTPDSNWSVTWHQDLAISVDHRATIAGFGPWSVKAGIVHVQPPVPVLENMLTLRIHLDSCGVDNGALQVIPESHRFGIAPHPPSPHPPSATCALSRGGAVLMRPLLWHSSAKAACPTRRRVVHVEFADIALPPPLDWYERH